MQCFQLSDCKCVTLGCIAAERTRCGKKTPPSSSDWLAMIVQLESGDMFSENKAGKECESVTEEGWRGPQIGHTQKTHSFARTHILDSKVTVTHQERNGAGREMREGRGGGERRKEIRHHLSVYKESNKY